MISLISFVIGNIVFIILWLFHISFVIFFNNLVIGNIVSVKLWLDNEFLVFHHITGLPVSIVPSFLSSFFLKFTFILYLLLVGGQLIKLYNDLFHN